MSPLVPCNVSIKIVVVPPQLLNKGEQGDENYTQVVPWMESLLFRQDGTGPAVDHEVNHHQGYKLPNGSEAVDLQVSDHFLTPWKMRFYHTDPTRAIARPLFRNNIGFHCGPCFHCV